MNIAVENTGRVFKITLNEVEAGQLLAILHGVYRTPSGIVDLENELANLEVEQVGYLGRDDDGDIAWLGGSNDDD
jgi:hypothetical protein